MTEHPGKNSNKTTQSQKTPAREMGKIKEEANRSGTKTSTPLLQKGDNQHKWISWAQNLLGTAQSQGLVGIFEGDKYTLEEPDEDLYAQKLQAAGTDHMTLVLQDWKQDLLKYQQLQSSALYLLKQSVSEELIHEFEDLKCARKDDPQMLFRLIQFRFQESRVHSMNNIWSKLRKINLASCKVVQHYVDKIRSYEVEFAVHGKSVDETFLINVLIEGLPPSYQDFVDQLHSDNFKRSWFFEIIVAALLKFQPKPKAFADDKAKSVPIEEERAEPEKSAHVAKTAKDGAQLNDDQHADDAHKRKVKPAGNRKYGRCTHCMKWGHSEEGCWEKHPELKPPRCSVCNKLGHEEGVCKHRSLVSMGLPGNNGSIAPSQQPILMTSVGHNDRARHGRYYGSATSTRYADSTSPSRYPDSWARSQHEEGGPKRRHVDGDAGVSYKHRRFEHGRDYERGHGYGYDREHPRDYERGPRA